MSLIPPIPSFVSNSLIYREFIEERNEILKHKWLESEKKGYDIGFENALFDWILNYRKNWRKYKFLKNI